MEIVRSAGSTRSNLSMVLTINVRGAGKYIKQKIY